MRTAVAQTPTDTASATAQTTNHIMLNPPINTDGRDTRSHGVQNLSRSGLNVACPENFIMYPNTFSRQICERLDRKQNLNARAFAVLRYCSNSLQHGEPPNGMKPLMPKTSQASSVGWQPRYECTRSNPSARSLRPSPLHHHDYARAAARVAQRCPPDHCGDRDPALERRAGMAGREGLRPVVTLPIAVWPGSKARKAQPSSGRLGAAAAYIASPRSVSTASCS
jgi:hypothetical protein